MKKIVCIDDDAVQQKYYRLLLKKMGLEFDIFSNAQEALFYLDSCKKHDVQLIITDYRMPLINGCEFIDMLETDIKCNIPIIMVTAQNTADIAEFDVMSPWIADFLQKPISQVEFQEMILQYLN